MSQFFQGVTTGSLPPVVATSYVTDDGVATPSGNILNILGGTDIETHGSGNTITIDFTGSSSIQIDGDTSFMSGSLLSLKGNSTAGSSIKFIGNGASSMTFNVTDSNSNTLIGNLSGNGTLTGLENTCVGEAIFPSLTSGSQNTSIGKSSCGSVSSGSSNSFLGFSSGGELTTGNYNSFFGHQSGNNLISGSYNILIGKQSGTNYTGSESSNIIIGNAGVVTTDNNIIRIGTKGVANGEQNESHIVGPIYSNDSTAGNVVYSFENHPNSGIGNNNDDNVYIVSNGVTKGIFGYNNFFTPSNQNQFSSGMTFQIANKSGSYGLANTDYAVFFDTSGGAYTATLPATPSDGQQHVIKDSSGNALANNLTIAGNGNNIDGAASYIMTTNYQSTTVIYNGSQWSVI